MAVWGAIGSWLGSNAGNLLNAGLNIYGANQAKDATQQAVQQATPTPYSTSSMYGTTNVDPRTRQVQMSMAQNPFAQMFNVGGTQALGNAYSAPGSAYYGAAPEIVSAANGVMDTGAEAQGRYDLLNQLAQPESNRMFQRLENNLFARGQMGTTGGGEQYRGYYEAQNQADLQRQLASQDWAQQRALSRFSTAQQAVGTGMNSQVQNFNIGNQSQQGLGSMFQNLINQAQIGIGSGSGTPGNVALANANAQTGPLQAGMAAANEAGVFDALGRWVGSKFSGASTPTGSVGPMAGGYQFPGATPPYVPQQPATAVPGVQSWTSKYLQGIL